MEDTSLNGALRHFEVTESNLLKAEKVLDRLNNAIPQGLVFEENLQYEDDTRAFYSIIETLPSIDGYKPEIEILGLAEIFQSRLDASEIHEPEIVLSVERRISEPSRLLRDYRFRFNQKRRELIRDALVELIDTVDISLRKLKTVADAAAGESNFSENPDLKSVHDSVTQIGTLIGNSAPRLSRWGDLNRHLFFSSATDCKDIVRLDWPAVKADLRNSLYGVDEPIPSGVDDLGPLVLRTPSGPVATQLQWDVLSDSDFERLLFALIGSENGYENASWLMKTNAPDRGRDLSVDRVTHDKLAGTSRQRVIIRNRSRFSTFAPAA